MQDNKKNSVKILGIDPGSRVMGWGIIKEESGVLSLVDCGAIKTDAKEDNFSLRLKYIYQSLFEICEEYQPDEAGIEQVFLAKNALSALKLGQARGVALAACFAHDILTFDYEATKIKQSIVGVGRAEKEQVAFMVRTLLNTNIKNKYLDTTDALAVAICHANTRRYTF